MNNRQALKKAQAASPWRKTKNINNKINGTCAHCKKVILISTSRQKRTNQQFCDRNCYLAHFGGNPVTSGDGRE